MCMVAMLRDHCALERELMPCRGSDAFGEVETYADLGSGSDGKRDRVAEGRRPGGDRHRIASAKRDSLNRAWSHARWGDRHRNSRRANEEGCGAVFVRKANANLRSSNGYAHALSHGLVFDVEQGFVWIGSR